MLSVNKQEIIPEADDFAFRNFVDNVLHIDDFEISEGMSAEEIDKILDEHTGHLEKKIDDHTTIEFGAKKVSGRGRMHYITLTEKDVSHKLVLWPLVRSDNNDTSKEGFWLYTNNDNGIPAVTEATMVDFIMSLVVCLMSDNN